MSSPPPASPSNIEYYSAHRGPVFGADGNFHHFVRQCDPVHLKNGYWKFSTYGDDRRAFDRGLNNPEEVLKAQDAGDGDYDDIMLRWVPGELDTSNKPSVGTAAAHLQSICNERKLLGKALSFRGAVPLYPLGTDPRLFQYRVTRYGIQKGVLPNDLLSPTSPSQGSSTAERVSASSTPVESPSHSTNRGPQSISAPALALSVPQPQSRPVQPLRSEPTPAISTPDRAPVRSSPLIPIREPVHLDDNTNFIEISKASLPTRHDRHEDSPLILQANNVDDTRSTPAFEKSNKTELYQLKEPSLVDDDDDACYTHGSGTIADDSTDQVTILTFASSTPADLFHAQVAGLPCMDCGLVEVHTSDCWINATTLSLKPTENLTTSELQRLADDVNKFDPGPWTTHFGPPQEVAEDTETQVQGLAEVIRNLDATAEDLELQELDDQSTILLWALKSIGKVHILEM